MIRTPFINAWLMLSVAKHRCVYPRVQSARDSSEILRFAQNDITRSTRIKAFIRWLRHVTLTCHVERSETSLAFVLACRQGNDQRFRFAQNDNEGTSTRLNRYVSQRGED